MAFSRGSELAGFRILEQIGQGGMAKVYKAYQPAMDRVVALKILPDLYAQDQSATARFQQEARIIARLEHPHILPVYDFSEEDETAFLVMRYLQAGNLKNLLTAAPDGRLSLADAALLTEQIALALDYAHQKGIVHRDVKPANVLIDPHGQAFLTDFGIAKVLEATQELTKTGSTLGTPAYMSPEQASGGEVDHRSDIYSLGIILYQMLTGTPPFEADTPYATIVAHLQEPLPLPSSLNPEIPEAVEQVLLKALARDPEDRFSSAGALAHALDQALKEEGIEKAQENVSPALLNLSGSLAGDRSSKELTIDDQELLKRATWERRRKKLMPWGIGIIFFVFLIGGTYQSRKFQNQLSDPQRAVEVVKQITQTARINNYATATQGQANRNATQTIIALTPPSTITLTTIPSPTVTPLPPPTLRPIPDDGLIISSPEIYFPDGFISSCTSMNIHPEENQLIIGTVDGIVSFELPSGQYQKRIDLYPHTYDIDWNLQENILAITTGGSITFLNTDTLKKIREVEISEFPALRVSWSPRYNFLAAAFKDGKITIVDGDSYHEIITFQAHSKNINSIAWSNDGQTLASGGAESTIALWDTTDWQLQTRISSYLLEGAIESLVWSQDDQYLISGSMFQVNIWNGKTAELIKNLSNHNDDVHGLAVSPNNQFFVSGSRDKTIILWDLETFAPLSTYNAHKTTISSLSWLSNSENFISADYDGTLILWKLDDSIGTNKK